MEGLPDYMEDDTRVKSNELVGKAISMLLQVSDFQQFRDMMMYEKTKVDEELAASKSSTTVTDLHTDNHDVGGLQKVTYMMDMVNEISDMSSTSKEKLWSNCLKLDWMQIDKQPVPEDRRKNKNDIYLRGVWTMNLSFTECCDMMFCMKERRSTWDPNFGKLTMPFGGHPSDDDMICSIKVSLGYLVNVVAFGDGTGMQLTTRNFRKWEEDRKTGEKKVVYAMVPWSIKENCLDLNHKFLSIKTGTIKSHPTDPDKCVMTTLEINAMGGMPKWALSLMMKATAPSLMKGLEQRYIKNVREKEGGLGENLTPFDDERIMRAVDEEGKDSHK